MQEVSFRAIEELERSHRIPACRKKVASKGVQGKKVIRSGGKKEERERKINKRRRLSPQTKRGMGIKEPMETSRVHEFLLLKGEFS
jgi:hypothetical protein